MWYCAAIFNLFLNASNDTGNVKLCFNYVEYMLLLVVWYKNLNLMFHCAWEGRLIADWSGEVVDGEGGCGFVYGTCFVLV